MRDKIKLGDVCTVVSGTTPKTGNDEYWNGDILWVTPAEITDDTFILNDTVRKITVKAVKESSLKPFPKGTVLLSSRAPIGKVAIAGKEMYCNQGFKNFICNTSLFNEYLYWFLKSKYDFLNSLGRGATFKEVSKSIVENVEIPLRDIVEQKHISSLMNKCQLIISLRNKQLKYLDDLIKFRFVEMFGDPKTNSMKLPLVKPEEICESISAGGDKPREVSVIKTDEFLYPIFSNGEKDDGLYGWSKEFRIEKPSVTVSGRGTIGYSSFRKEGKFTPIIRLIVLTPNEKTNPIYLTYFLNLEREIGSGSGVQQLTVPMIKAKNIILPKITDQNEFSEFIQHIDKLKFSFHKSIDETQRLFDSLMQEYFG